MTDTPRTSPAFRIAQHIFTAAAKADFVPNDEIQQSSDLHDYCDANVVFYAPAFEAVTGKSLVRLLNDDHAMAILDDAFALVDDWIAMHGLTGPDEDVDMAEVRR